MISRTLGVAHMNMKETMIETTVTYTLEMAGKFYLIESVPARVCKETGEQFFAPETVEHIQALIKSNRKPDRVIETPVYRFG
jgi:YgiT-type zinc finger domain-containing protein